MLHTKYQGSMQDPISLCRICDGRGGAIFGPRGIFEQLGKGPLGDAAY